MAGERDAKESHNCCKSLADWIPHAASDRERGIPDSSIERSNRAGTAFCSLANRNEPTIGLGSASFPCAAQQEPAKERPCVSGVDCAPRRLVCQGEPIQLVVEDFHSLSTDALEPRSSHCGAKSAIANCRWLLRRAAPGGRRLFSARRRFAPACRQSVAFHPAGQRRRMCPGDGWDC